MNIEKIDSLQEPNFKPLRDDDSVIGFSHTRIYSIGGCDSDGHVSVSCSRWSWGDSLAAARELMSHGAHHVLIQGIERTGNGYFPATLKTHFAVRAN